MKKLFLSFLIFGLFSTGYLNAADPLPTISIDENIIPVGNEVVVPVKFQNLVDVGAVSLKIQYNGAALTYTGYSNQPSNGTFLANATGDIIGIAWFATSPLLINNNKFVDLHFTFIGGSALTFITAECEISPILGDPITSIEYVNGSVIGDIVDTSKIVSLNTDVAPAGTKVTVPVIIKNLSNAAAVSLKIQFNSSVLTYTNATNKPSQGNLISNADGDTIKIAWFNVAPLGIDSGKFVDLNFTYNNGATSLSFLTAQCEITDPDGNFITPIVYLNGSVVANLPPQFTVEMSDTMRINENQELNFQYQATDPNPGALLKYSFAKKPVGAAIDSLTGLFTWTPAYNQEGVHEVSIIVSDGGLKDTSKTSFIIVGNVNQPPVFNSVLSDTIIHQMQTLTFQYQASDPDGGKVLLKSAGLKFKIVSIPTGATLDSLTGIFNWKPTYKQIGDTSIVSISDGQFEVPDTAIITVLKTNVAPVFTQLFGTDTLHANRTYNFQLKADDPNGDPVTFSLGANPPAGTSITSDVFKWIIASNQVGNHTVIIRVSDGTLFKDTTLNITITTAVGVENERNGIPQNYGLKQNYPNPFNPSTKISYQLPQADYVTLKVYNMVGKEVVTLVNEEKPAGYYQVNFSSSDMPSGIYFYELKAGSYSEVRKMLLLK
jgi:hypothetical protein